MQTSQFQLHAKVEHRHWWFRARAQIVRELVHELTTPTTGQKVVEVGCGTGGTLASLRHEYDCLGVDPNEEAIALARRRFPTVQFRCGFAPDSIEDVLPQTDVVMLLDVLEHVEDDTGLLRSLVDSIKPSAHLIATVPADMTLWSPHDEVYGHYRRYNIPTLTNLWRQLPVEPQLVSPMNTRLYGCIRTARMLSSLRGKASGQAGTDLRLPWKPMNWALERVFSGERSKIIDQLRSGDTPPSRHGVSLIAVLKRTQETTVAQPILPQTQPQRRAA